MGYVCVDVVDPTVVDALSLFRMLHVSFDVVDAIVDCMCCSCCFVVFRVFQLRFAVVVDRINCYCCCSCDVVVLAWVMYVLMLLIKLLLMLRRRSQENMNYERFVCLF